GMVGFCSLQVSSYLAFGYCCLLLVTAYYVWHLPLSNTVRVYRSLLFISLRIICGALLVNLKRGPWLGVAFGLSIILLFSERRLIPPLLLVICIVIGTLTPVRDRLIGSAKDFFMNGGRSDIWMIGSEL